MKKKKCELAFFGVSFSLLECVLNFLQRIISLFELQFFVNFCDEDVPKITKLTGLFEIILIFFCRNCWYSIPTTASLPVILCSIHISKMNWKVSELQVPSPKVSL